MKCDGFIREGVQCQVKVYKGKDGLIRNMSDDQLHSCGKEERFSDGSPVSLYENLQALP